MNVVKDIRVRRNFLLSEFRCPCGCNGVYVSDTLTEALQQLRDLISEQKGEEHKIAIVSGYRCKSYNDSLEGSAPNSHHLYGEAADIRIYNTETGLRLSPDEAMKYAMRVDSFTGFGLYPTAIHVDVGHENVTVWDRRK